MIIYIACSNTLLVHSNIITIKFNTISLHNNDNSIKNNHLAGNSWNMCNYIIPTCVIIVFKEKQTRKIHTKKCTWYTINIAKDILFEYLEIKIGAYNKNYFKFLHYN